MPERLDVLKDALQAALGERAGPVVADRGELTVEVAHGDLGAAMMALRDEPSLAFSTLIDLIGMDYHHD